MPRLRRRPTPPCCVLRLLIGSFCFLQATSIFPKAQEPATQTESQPTATLRLGSPQPTKRSLKRLYNCTPGPWGELEYYFAFLEAPSTFVEELNFAHALTVTWHFPGRNPEDAQSFFKSLGFDKDATAWMKKFPEGYALSPGFVRLFPPPEFVARLSPSQRGALAKVLAQFHYNRDYYTPAVIQSGDASSWFRAVGLRPRTIDLIKPLIYERNGVKLLSDWAYVHSQIESPAERLAFRHALTRTRTLVLRLRVSPDTNIDSLTNYWSVGYRQKAIAPILKAVAQTPGIETIDVVHLLPPQPRRLLYTYPSLEMISGGSLPDCFWTVGNFFKIEIDESFRNSTRLSQELKKRWKAAEKPLRFGDCLIIADAKNKPVHGMTYIADDIVFTKNGPTIYAPWIFMRYDDVLNLYRMEGDISIYAYRLEPR